MKKYLILFLATVFVGLVATIATQQRIIVKELEEKTRYQNNTEALLKDVEVFKTSDSLNAAKVNQLELTKKELLRHCTEELNEVEKLKVKVNNLSRLAKTTTKTEAKVQTPIYETKIKVDSIFIPIKCFEFEDNYLSVKGCFVNDSLQADISMEDTLTITEEVKYKRFLGFLWKTSKIKEQHWSILSSNPHTKINDFKVVKIIY